ncbi:MAG: ABC transporter substrate-binding protein [Gaiellaceae bacterium]
MARPLALAAAIAVSLLAVAGAGGAAKQQTPKRGGTVTIQGSEPPCLSVLISPCKELNLPIRAVLYGAFELGPDYVRRPKLVSHVDFTTKPPFTLTYHIRPEARWSDGTPITARDFLFTYRARLKYPLNEDDPHNTRVLRVIKVDAKTVRVVLRSRFFAWQEALFDVVLPQHALRGENLEKVWSDRIDNPKTGRPIGSGPFLVDDLDRGKQLTLVRNTRYWGPHASYLDIIIVRFVGPTDLPGMAERLRNGETDIEQWQIASADELSEVRRVPNIKLLIPPDAPGWEHLDIRIGSGGHPALENKLIRRALAYGIDRVAIVRAVLGEIGLELRPLDSVILRSSSRSYRPNWSTYRYRPAEARLLLERAGCRRGGDGIYSCAGERLSLRFVSRGNFPRRVQTLELVQAQLMQAGVEVVPLYVLGPGHNRFLETGAFDVTLFGWFDSGPEGDGKKELYGCGGELNYMGYCQRLVTRDLDQSDRILDAGQRARVLNRADTRMARDVPTIPLFELPSLAAVRSTVRGFVPNLVDATWNAENWWLER